MGSSSTNTRGFFLWTVAIAIIGWLSSVAVSWWNGRNNTGRSVIKALRGSKVAGIVLLILVLVFLHIIYTWSLIDTIYVDHQNLVTENTLLRGLGGGDQYSIPMNNQYVAMMNTIGAFKGLSGKGNACNLRISYGDKESENAAVVLRNLSSVSDCKIEFISPQSPDGMSDENEFKSVPETILVRTRRTDTYAFAVALGNSFNVKTSSALPKSDPQDLLWLQIGRGNVLRKH